ncbi:MAG: zinc ribbon domain-containing protein [Clostridia bacterium]|nr:zinc ribbon domain-containing protein [Clostridia bacterium]
MPVYDYKCPKCGTSFEELVKSPSEAVTCPVCGEVAERSYSGKIYTATGKISGGCGGNCSSCANRCR